MKATLLALLARISLRWILIALGVILVLGLLWYRRRQQLRAAPPPLPRGRLLDVWLAFLLPLPGRVRRAVSRYPWVLVLGESGVGKSQVIDAQLDWRGLQSQFLPSHNSDPLLQIYQGTGLLVHEVGAALLADSSDFARQALTRLWRRLLRHFIPRAVVVMDAQQKSTPEQLQRTAQRMRGKLALLGDLAQAPIPTRVCLTHMDQLVGYPVYARLVGGQHLTEGVPLQSGRDLLGALDLQALGSELPLALISLSSQDFRALLAFQMQAADQLAGVAEFLRLLGAESPLIRAPQVESVCLFSPPSAEQVGDALHGRHLRSRNLSRLRSPGLRRALLGSAIAALSAVLIYFAVQHQAERQRVRLADEAVAALEQYIDHARSTLDSMDSSVVQNASLLAGQRVAALRGPGARFSLAPRIYGDRKREVKAKFIQALRSGFLLPALERSRARQDADRTLRALAVLYATRTNKLSKPVRQQTADIARLLGLQENVINDYVENSDTPWPLRVSLPPFTDAGKPSPATDLSFFAQLFADIERLSAVKMLTRPQVAKLHQAIVPFQKAVEEVRRGKQTRELLPLVAEEARLDAAALFGRSMGQGSAATWISFNEEPLRGFLTMLKDTSLDGPPPSLFRSAPPLIVSPAPLPNAPSAPNAPRPAVKPPRVGPGQAPARARSVLLQLSTQTSGDPGLDAVYRFTLQSRKHTFSARAWWELVLRSRKKVLVNTLVRGPRRGKHRAPLFDWRAGEFQGDPPPLYTKDTFERVVRPTILETERALASPQMGAREKKTLSRFVQREMERYALGYRAALLQKLQGMTVKRDSLGPLHVALAEMVQPTSAFTEALAAVAEDGALERLDGPFLRPMVTNQVLFAPLVRMMVKKDGVYAELEKYRAHLAKVVRDLDNRGAAPGGAGGELELAELLSPAGRVAMRILLEQEGSPLRQVEDFLDKGGVIGQLRQPFLDPVLNVYRFGLQDISRVIAAQWGQQLQRQVAPLLLRFPFNRRATQDVDLAALEALRLPDGAFWQQFRHVIAPVCLERQGSFVERRGSLQQVELPRGMLPLVNQLQVLARTLWDKEGKRRPLVYQIYARGLPLPPPASADAKTPAVTLSFLNHGQSSTFGINARAASTTFTVAWWSNESASVGLELSVPGSPRKQTLSLDVVGSPFSFLRLVAQARVATDGLAIWSVPAEQPGWSREVRFHLGADPFAPFQLRGP